MSRHRHKQAIAGIAERAAAARAVREELAKTYSLSPDDPRIHQASIIKANQANWEARIALGYPVPSAELTAFSETIVQLLGKPPAPAFRIAFVDTLKGVCEKCGHMQPMEDGPRVDPETGKISEPEPEPVAPKHSPAEVVAAKPDTQAPAPAVPLRKPEPAKPPLSLGSVNDQLLTEAMLSAALSA